MTLAWLIASLSAGAAAGFLAGLFGVGGGLILVPSLVLLLPAMGVPPQHLMHAALATSLACIVLTAIASTRAHAARGAVSWAAVAWLAPGLILGASAGAYLAGSMSDAMLRLGVGVYCLITATTLIRGKKATPAGAVPPADLWLSVAGLPIGVLSALVGIGGGSMIVPLLIHRGGAAVRAVATSAACGLPIALAAALSSVPVARLAGAELPAGFLGFVHWPGAVSMGVASIWMAPYGARLAHRLAHQQLSRLFATLLAGIGILMLWRALA